MDIDTRESLEILKRSKFVHSSWYKAQYPDVEELGMAPVEHYLKYGAAMGRDPGTSFHTQYYRETYPDAGQSGLNPVVHYMEHGQRLGYRRKASGSDPVKQARNRIGQIRAKLLGLGFTELPLRELAEMAASGESAVARALAAHELALWYMRGWTENGCRTALEYVAKARSHSPDLALCRQLVTAELLCHHALEQTAAGHAAYTRAALAGETDADTMLAWANFQPTPDGRIAWINQVLRRFDIAPVKLSGDPKLSPYDRLTAAMAPDEVTDGPLVTVLVAAHNADDTLPTALRSLQQQSWQKLEIIVIDDASSDDTVAVAEGLAAVDPRIRLIRMSENGGAYVARNAGLDAATGIYVTLHDADGWVHPSRIETQVRFLEENPQAMACTVQQAHAGADLSFAALSDTGGLITRDATSLLFRRDQVSDALGYWDIVSFGADEEFIRRMRHIFGADNVCDLSTGPLTLGRLSQQQDNDVSWQKQTGAQRIYDQINKSWIDTHENLRLERKPAQRAFYAPAPMRVFAPAHIGGRKHFDVIIASDFKLPGGTSSSNAEEVIAQHVMGLNTALVEFPWYGANPYKLFNQKIVDVVNDGRAEVVVHGEDIYCDVLVIRQPLVLDPLQDRKPSIHAKDVRVIINQPPKRDYGPGSENIYDLKSCAEAVQRNFGSIGTWHPIGPLVRDALLDHHAHELGAINLDPQDWPNIINPADWRRPARPRRPERPIRICRHSRDGYVKWPGDRETLLQAYPTTEEFEIHVLGGATVPATILGGDIPGNWRVSEFGSRHPRDFLAEHDIFVYFTHPDWIEAFGRAIFEPMCVGLPVILPVGLGYEKLFGEAAIYAHASEVADIARRLASEAGAYDAQVNTAFRIVNERFSYKTHAERLGKAMGRAISAPG